jgi:hypothetical protein
MPAFNHSLENSITITKPLRYEALSYVWGDPSFKSPISMDKHYLKLRENPYSALMRLRYPNRARILWVDAICINQNDVKQQEQQIPFMAEIYGQAVNVVAWLGKVTDDSDEAFKAISLAKDTAYLHSLSNDRITQGAILALLQRPWFRRIWVSVNKII